MRLQAGTRVGPYEVLSPIGSGGMGEVYRARDTRLDRTVAIKVLTTALAVDGDARDRFTREAKAISALNHPNICALYDVGQDGDIEFLVFELLEGETLAARLGRGPLPIREVVRFGMEIADALEAAHRQGIVHRDLKPGNIMLTASHVKLLDFGLAKRTLGLTGHARSTEETATQAATALGTVLGTLHYMAPEQLQGLPADARTDIFALGAVLYEMTSGRKAFDGATPPSVLAKILETEPTPVTTIAPTTPAALEQLIRACLTKERAERWQNVHDLLFQLRWIEGQLSASPPAHVVRGPARRERLAWTLVVATLAAAAWILVRPAGGNVIPRGAPSRTDVLLPPRLWLHEWADYPAISPDGRALVFAGVVDGIRKLYLRPLNEASVQPLPNTEGAYRTFLVRR